MLQQPQTRTTKATGADLDADPPGPGGVGSRFGSEVGNVAGVGGGRFTLAAVDVPNWNRAEGREKRKLNRLKIPRPTRAGITRTWI